MKVVVVAGARGEGKTSFLNKWLTLLPEVSDIYGFYTPRFVKDTGEEGYKIRSVKDDLEMVLCSRCKLEQPSMKIGNFWFDQRAVSFGEDLLFCGLQQNFPVLFVIDEIGKFEMEGLVWDRIFRKILEHDQGTLIVAVRDRFVNEVVRHYDLEYHDWKVLPVSLPAIELVNEIEGGQNNHNV